MTTSNDFKQHRSLTNRMKRKASLINCDIHSVSTINQNDNNEFNLQMNELTSNFNDKHENDNDDYADRIFNYLNEASTKDIPSLSVRLNEMNSSSPSILSENQSDKNIKPFLCAFCPFTAQNIQEFQSHIAKHTEKNFRCLLCNCMYKYRRDCVTHMKRKHSNNVTGSISQYIQKITNNSIQPSTSSNSLNGNKIIETKRYGCPYCSLMTKSTSSIYKHQSRKHANCPKIVHKYSTDDPTTRNLVAVLKQKPTKHEQNSPSVSSSTCIQNSTDSFSMINRHRCAASKHITAHTIHSSNGRLSKLFQCCLCGYRARHRSNVVRHVKKIHTVDPEQTNLSVKSETIEHPLTQSDDNDEKINSDEYNFEKKPNYSFRNTIQAPIVFGKINENNQSTKSYADIHLSINIFLPNKIKRNSSDIEIFDENTTNSIDSDNDIHSDNDTSIIHQMNSSDQQNCSYKPHKCCRCFYRSNWKTDMLHHIRFKHHIPHATKSDYISMDFDSALRTFSNYEKTFGKVLKNRLLLPKIDYTDCTWEELKSKLFLNDEQKHMNQQSSRSSSYIDQTAAINKSITIDEQ